MDVHVAKETPKESGFANGSGFATGKLLQNVTELCQHQLILLCQNVIFSYTVKMSIFLHCQNVNFLCLGTHISAMY